VQTELNKIGSFFLNEVKKRGESTLLAHFCIMNEVKEKRGISGSFCIQKKRYFRFILYSKEAVFPVHFSHSISKNLKSHKICIKR
jgi:hypothetical protein